MSPVVGGPLIRPAVMPKLAGPGAYTLQFEYACRKNIKFESCQGKAFWNGNEVANVVPVDHKRHVKTAQVEVQAGEENVLRFEGSGEHDSFGLTIDNVKLTKVGSTENIVINGGFEQPDLKGKWKIFNEIPGWSGKGI
jgi:hypothetical protein